ncbi:MULTISPECIES: ABC transporter permease [Bradyrhizobium]|uniref:ABC transporter permease n=1 Tax=Bradyrhizobium TaxID=374 RepID=UPI00041FE587|nr:MULTISPECIES: ABC transporter permease [Bradyrhizobium]WLB88527.1 ABC transporter permease [Bradyrhizobium japonicum USDA 135]GLR98999.1 ABC transporter permease [Bradyrhizobium liaoningense]
MRLGNLLQLGIKELCGLARDPVLLVLIAYSFTFAVYEGANTLPETLNRAAIAIVDEDHSPISTRIGMAFTAPYFSTPRLISQYEMDRRMDAGLDTFALDIPPDFQRDLLARKAPTIQLNVDATRISQAFNGGGYVEQIVNAEIAEFLARTREAQTPQIDLALRARFNPELKRSWFGAIDHLIMSITMLSIILTGAALIREREHGTIEHLLVMPVTPLEIMVSKVWSMGAVVLVASALSIAFVVKGWLAVTIDGSVALFLVGTALQLFATTSMGIFLATVAGSMPQFGLLLIMILLPLQTLSGSMTPRESMPQFVQDIMLAAPNTHFVMLAQAILFRGAGLEAVWPQLVALTVIGSVFFVIALRRFRAFLA